MNHHRPEGGPVAVVVAATDACRNLDRTLARFAAEAGPLGEVILVDASGSDAAEAIVGRLANVRRLCRPAGRLAPVLWRDGLRATDAPLVAFSTAQMLPDPGWLASLGAGLAAEGVAGVGGPIAPGDRLSATGRAVALLRYSNYFPPLPDLGRVDPPGDNALYRRDRLREVESAWADGFWEVDVHRALRDRGDRLAMAPGAVVAFQGGVPLATLARQRFEHARRYGAGRSRGLSRRARLVRVASAPMVPPLLGARIAAALRARGMGPLPWLPSLPSLAVLASAWAIGEAAGTWPVGADGPRRPDRVEQTCERANR